MNRYRVFAGVATIGAGQVLALTGQQIKDRAQFLELPRGYELHAKDPTKEKPPIPKDAVVKTTASVDFIVGEEIGMPDLPQYLIGKVEPLDPPKSENDEHAADVVLLKRDPKAHAKKIEGKRAAAAAAKAAAKAKR